MRDTPRILSDEHGIRETWHSDIHDGEKHIIYTEQDAQPITDANLRRFNSFDERSRWKDGMNHVARIPEVIVLDLQRRGIWDDHKALLRWLDQPENAFLRTRPGKLSR